VPIPIGAPVDPGFRWAVHCHGSDEAGRVTPPVYYVRRVRRLPRVSNTAGEVQRPQICEECKPTHCLNETGRTCVRPGLWQPTTINYSGVLSLAPKVIPPTTWTFSRMIFCNSSSTLGFFARWSLAASRPWPMS